MCFNGYHLDQGKHAGLLVEASKAGKWHLLEHVFDATLEAGEIPDPTLFAEILCQAMLQYDYEKAVTIVNTMALAPFQFDKKEWFTLFEKNKDRINSDDLRILYDTLSNCNLSKEFTALELVKALESVCGGAVDKDEYEDCDSDGNDRGRSDKECLSIVDDVGSDGYKYNVFDKMHSPDDSDSEEAEDREDSQLPSAVDILEFWKELREKDKTTTHVI